MALDKNNSKLTDNEADKVNGGADAIMVWRCGDCGSVSQTEVSVCPNCGSAKIVGLYKIDSDTLIM